MLVGYYYPRLSCNTHKKASAVVRKCITGQLPSASKSLIQTMSLCTLIHYPVFSSSLANTKLEPALQGSFASTDNVLTSGKWSTASAWSLLDISLGTNHAHEECWHGLEIHEVASATTWAELCRVSVPACHITMDAQRDRDWSDHLPGIS